MIIKHENPPEWIMTGCLSSFRVDPMHTVWTYGDTLYNPGGIFVTEDLLAHEQTHQAQQERIEGGKDAWWRQYLADPEFRLEQELQAYGMQYAYYCTQRKDRNQRFRFLYRLASTLAGPLYQVAISRSDAQAAIKEVAIAAQPTLL